VPLLLNVILTLQANIIPISIAVVCTLIVAVPLVWKLATNYRIKIYEAKVGSAEERARGIIDDAYKTAETTKKEALLEMKEESIRSKNESEREAKERRAEVQRYEKRVLSKEETLDRKLEALEKKESKFNAKEAEVEKLRKELGEAQSNIVKELEKISGLTSEQAKDIF